MQAVFCTGRHDFLAYKSSWIFLFGIFVFALFDFCGDCFYNKKLRHHAVHPPAVHTVSYLRRSEKSYVRRFGQGGFRASGKGYGKLPVLSVFRNDF